MVKFKRMGNGIYLQVASISYNSVTDSKGGIIAKVDNNGNIVDRYGHKIATYIDNILYDSKNKKIASYNQIFHDIEGPISNAERPLLAAFWYLHSKR